MKGVLSGEKKHSATVGSNYDSAMLNCVYNGEPTVTNRGLAGSSRRED